MKATNISFQWITKVNLFSFQVAVRITLWDGSWKSVGLGEKQTVGAVQRTLAEKLHSTTYWKYSLYLLSGTSERKLDSDEIPLVLLQENSSAKLLCKLDESAREPVSFSDIPDTDDDEDKKVSRDPLLELPEFYLRARASSFQQVRRKSFQAQQNVLTVML